MCTLANIDTHTHTCTCNPSPKLQVFQPLILGHQRVIGGHWVVNRDRPDGLQISCNSVHTIYEAVDYVN